jgi:hypothetical protein
LPGCDEGNRFILDMDVSGGREREGERESERGRERERKTERAGRLIVVPPT